LTINHLSYPGLFIELNIDERVFVFVENQTFEQLQLPSSSISFEQIRNIVSLRTLEVLAELTDEKAIPEKFTTLSFITKNGIKSFSSHIRKTNSTIYITGVERNDNARLAEMKAETDSLKKELEEFAYIASHDLQEPVRKVATYVERMLDKLPPNEQENLKVYTDRISNSISNMRTLIDDLLQFARSAKEPQQFQEVSLTTIVEKAIADNDLKIDETKAKIFLQPLPNVDGDPTQLLQVFTNLINNALKFVLPVESPVIYINTEKISTEELETYGLEINEYHKIIVRDEGIGFKKEFAGKMFQMFQRLNAKQAYPGSGIGLAICKKIIQNHKGIITADSNGSKGATFTILLPVKQPSHA
jgi:light-regulated signal transduction histidine kinase (bacteriophytochrome)